MIAFAGMQLVAIAVALLCLGAAAIWDMARFEIPDQLSVIVLVSALVFGAGQPGFAWPAHLAAPVLVLAAGLFVFARGWLGGGDIKMLVATAAWTGLSGMPLHLAFVGVAGGGLAIVVAVLRQFSGARQATGSRAWPLLAIGAPLPYAVAIAMGTVLWAWQAYASI